MIIKTKDFQTIRQIPNNLLKWNQFVKTQIKQKKAEEDITYRNNNMIDHSLQLTINSNCYEIKNKRFSNIDFKNFIMQ